LSSPTRCAPGCFFGSAEICLIDDARWIGLVIIASCKASNWRTRALSGSGFFGTVEFSVVGGMLFLKRCEFDYATFDHGKITGMMPSS